MFNKKNFMIRQFKQTSKLFKFRCLILTLPKTTHKIINNIFLQFPSIKFNSKTFKLIARIEIHSKNLNFYVNVTEISFKLSQSTTVCFSDSLLRLFFFFPDDFTSTHCCLLSSASTTSFSTFDFPFNSSTFSHA
mgnify:CR=1 FL=1